MRIEKGRGWIGVAMLAAFAYAAIGKLFALPAEHVQVWRLAAWAASGVVYLAQIAHEHFARRSRPGVTAWHAAVGAAAGGFLLAIAGPLHFFLADIRPNALLALVLWPIITGVPAFVIALVVAFTLGHVLSGATEQ